MPVLELAREIGLPELAPVALDSRSTPCTTGTARSWSMPRRSRADLEAEIAALLRAADHDQAEVVDGMSMPEESPRP